MDMVDISEYIQVVALGYQVSFGYGNRSRLSGAAFSRFSRNGPCEHVECIKVWVLRLREKKNSEDVLQVVRRRGRKRSTILTPRPEKKRKLKERHFDPQAQVSKEMSIAIWTSRTT